MQKKKFFLSALYNKLKMDLYVQISVLAIISAKEF